MIISSGDSNYRIRFGKKQSLFTTLKPSQCRELIDIEHGDLLPPEVWSAEDFINVNHDLCLYPVEELYDDIPYLPSIFFIIFSGISCSTNFKMELSIYNYLNTYNDIYYKVFEI